MTAWITYRLFCGWCGWHRHGDASVPPTARQLDDRCPKCQRFGLDAYEVRS